MSNPPPPRPDPKTQGARATIAYAFYAAAIWGLVAYSLWGHKPPARQILAEAGRACIH